ncbi:hypothetical protein ABVT39_017898 [Epinephelus coioides]
MADNLNIVDRILAKPFESLPYEEKLTVKQQGRSTPQIDLVQRVGKSNRSFQLPWYDKPLFLMRFTSRIVSTVANNYDALLQTFEKIIADKTMDDDTLGCAKGFVMKLEDFEFVFMLYTYEQIFSETDVVFDIVQQRAMDVLYCKNRIESLLACQEETACQREEDPKERYRNLYMAILDNLTEQIPRRFANLESMRFLELVSPGKFDEMRQVFPEEAFQSVLKSYGQFFDLGRLRSELQVLYSNQDLQGKRRKLCDFLLVLKDMELDNATPQLYKLLSLVATIGATSAGVERSFSCLKRLKSDTRNTMGQDRLSSLALLAIERTLVKSLEKTPSWYNRVTDRFLEKERRVEFTYK